MEYRQDLSIALIALSNNTPFASGGRILEEEFLTFISSYGLVFSYGLSPLRFIT